MFKGNTYRTCTAGEVRGTSSYGFKKLRGFKKPETNVQNFTFQATTTLQGGWGLTLVGPRTHLRNPIGQESMCARFIGNSDLDPVKPYINYSAPCILK